MTDVKMYNVVTYDGVDSYVIKTLGRTEEDIIKTFEPTDMEILKMDELYVWDDLDEHIKGALEGKWELGGGNNDLRLAILRFLDVKTGLWLQ